MFSASLAPMASCLLLFLTPRLVTSDKVAGKADVTPSKLRVSPTVPTHVNISVPIGQDLIDMTSGNECIVNVSGFQGGLQSELFKVAIHGDSRNSSGGIPSTCYHLLLRCIGGPMDEGVYNLSVVAVSCAGGEDAARERSSDPQCTPVTLARRESCGDGSPEDENTLQTDAILAGTLSCVASILMLVVAATVVRRSKGREVDAENGDSPPSVLKATEILAANMATAAGSPLQVISSSVLKLGDRIGAGRYGVVYAATMDVRESADPVPVAVKTLTYVSEMSAETRALISELRLMQSLAESKHIVKILLGGVYQGQPCMVMEYVEGGNLHKYLRHAKASAALLAPDLAMVVSPYEVLDISLQVAKGMNCLVENKVVHRSLATRNLLVHEQADGYLQVKIADLGISRQMLDDSTYHSVAVKTSPLKWMALDTIKDGVFSSKSDVWSFGVVVWEIVTCGESPYQHVENWMLQAYLESGQRLLQPIACPDEIYRIMTFCWHADPTDRPSFSELITICSANVRREKNYLDLLGEGPSNAKSSPLNDMDVGWSGECDLDGADAGCPYQAMPRKSATKSRVLPALTAPFRGFEACKRYTLPPGMCIADPTETTHPVHASTT